MPSLEATMRIQAEITRLKALREFGGALRKPYGEWTDEEKRACCMLDMLWRRENGFSDKPDPDDPEHYSTLGERLSGADEAIREDWRAGIMRFGKEWTRGEARRYRSDPRFLRKVHKGISGFWKALKKLFGFRDTDDVSPFEAIRAEKILETPGMNFRIEARRILREDYASKDRGDPVLQRYRDEGLHGLASEIGSLPPEERARLDSEVARAAGVMARREKIASARLDPESDELIMECWRIRDDFAKTLKGIAQDAQKRMRQGAAAERETVEKAIRNGKAARIAYSRVFAAAMDKPFSQWTREERTACHVLDAIWRRERGLSDQPAAWNNNHWDRLCKSIQNASKGDQLMWKADIAGCGGAAMRRIESACKSRAGFWNVTWNRLSKAWSALSGGVNDISPFEAIRAQKVLDDPSLGIIQATREIQRHAMDAETARVQEAAEPGPGGVRMEASVEREAESCEEEPVQYQGFTPALAM